MDAFFSLPMKLIHHLILGAVLGAWILHSRSLPETKASEEVSATAQQYLMNLSMSQKDAFVLIEECRKTEQPNKCVKFAWAVWAQEWGYDTRHPFGMLRQPSRYKWVKEKTTEQYAELRVGSFKRYRIRNNTPQDYLTRSRYCTSWCEHRVPNVTRFIAGYDSGIIPQEWAKPVWTADLINTYEIARQASIKRQNVEKALSTAILEEHKARKDCIDSKQCK